MNSTRVVGLLLGPFLMLAMMSLPAPEGMLISAWKALAIMVLMIIWWVSEAVPVPITSLLPVALFPFFSILTMKEAVAPYSNPAIFLFLGGFIIAIAIEKWNLHRRIALQILKATGTNGDGIVGGFILATGFLSMWMSNTATVVMMMPIGASVIDLLSDMKDSKGFKNFAASLMLSITFAASIGGMATIIGTPTNGVFVAFMKEAYNFEVSFIQWSIIALPISIIFLFLCWILLVKFVFPNYMKEIKNSSVKIEEELKKLGPMKNEEKIVALVFSITALLWIVRVPIKEFYPSINLSDESIAIFSAISFFLIPSNIKKWEFLMDWNTANKLPWGILLLFGGGLSLAFALEKTGVINYIADIMASMNGVSDIGMIVLFTTIISIATTFIGNMTLATITVPILASISIGFGINPIYAALPATLAASCSFMLPMSTPPNAIIYGSEHVNIKHMIKSGFVMNIVGIVLISLIVYLICGYAFNMDMSVVPDWAIDKK